MKQERWMVGVMSGTSADGVDASLVRIQGTGLHIRVRPENWVSKPYPLSLRQTILRVREQSQVSLSELGMLAAGVSDVYTETVLQLLEKTEVKAQTVSAIACHGQTLFHSPPWSIQWLDPSRIAQKIGIDVISDFRRADLAVGGQGAPLVPFADWVLFRSPDRDRVILNLGGIANITILPRAGGLDQVRGFDTGPANCISDWLMRDRGGIDEGGKLALSGNPDPQIVQQLMSDEYFSRSGPKSTDGPEMIRIWKRYVRDPMRLEDQLATAAQWVAQSVHQTILPLSNPELIVAGGGTRNAAIMQYFPRAIPSDLVGIPSQARESVAFAILGCATLDRVCANLPSVTGADRSVVLGAIYPATR